MTKKVILCNCMDTQPLDAEALEHASGLGMSPVHRALCTDQSDLAAKLMAHGDVIIACQQERAFFEMLAEEIDAPMPGFVDLRDRAGWSDQAEQATPKMAALAAEAQVPVTAPKVVDVISEGTCLIIGPGEAAFAAAADLSGSLAVTVLQTDSTALPIDRRFDVVRGRLSRVSGALGGFELRIDAFQSVVPGGRGDLTLTAPQDGAASFCDIIFDLRADQPLFPAPDKREGYLRADPRAPGAVATATRAAAELVGTFEKPLYVRLEPSLCAHSRAEQVGCTRCLDVCPTGAITPDGEHVTIDPMVCAGCGSCAALCPSGAIAYDAPPVDSLFRRLDVLSRTYRGAGGQTPRLLVHDAAHGAEMIRLAARFGRGLPADVIPLEVEALAGFGHAETLAALACGFATVEVLLSPKTERDALVPQADLTNAVAGRDAVRLHDLADPDALSDVLYGAPSQPALGSPVLPIGSRRQVARLAAKALRPEAREIPLPKGAPYGAVLVDTEACTLCLSCVSLCPSGALMDNEDKPQLLFQEDACLQCGICATICPEKAITLKPQFNLTDTALSQQVLNEEEPFACIECGSLFGVKSTIEKISEKLAGKHSMFAKPEAARMIQMCDKCRINAQYHSDNNPFAMGERPKPRTTDDYYSKRKDH